MSKYRKPNGEFTSKFEEYDKAWKAFLDPVKEALGVGVLGFDPGVLVFEINNPDKTHNIDTWLLEKIYAAITGKKIVPDEQVEQCFCGKQKTVLCPRCETYMLCPDHDDSMYCYGCM